ncbi:hypothetical protein LMG28614_05669 [Paraburkholderia ultramafica]|uniref:Uncharacterized protein n=1 Tax=Paraburkholderia ultramafica TaxID=1544867 RepID=A0A6S7BY40_9BURK|nr:hypothetical protein LMG28614_05669 [Paraburkholderia ultramafica]
MNHENKQVISATIAVNLNALKHRLAQAAALSAEAQ